MGLSLLEPIVGFINQGGFPLWLLAALALVMWSMVLYHGLFVLFGFRPLRAELIARWQQGASLRVWHRKQLKKELLSLAKVRFAGPLVLLKTVVALCPLLGLLGTVTGMIEVFEVLAVMGTSDARMMASGVARATLPTMAGMVLAIVGLFFISRFESFATRQQRALEDTLGAAR